MMPKTSVRPAAIRNSMTPNCRPLRHCSRTSNPLMEVPVNERGAGGPAPLARARSPALPLHRALMVVGVLVVLEDRLLDLHLDLGAALDGLQQIEVLDGMVVDVVGELPAGRLEVGLPHGGHHALLVAEVALDGAHRRVDQHDAVVALGAVERRRVAELLLEVSHVLLVCLVLEVRAPVASLAVAESGVA